MSDEQQVNVSERDNGSYRVPLTGLVARRLILKCFEQKDQWTRQDLAKAVEQRHFKEGGFQGAQPVVMVVKKVLSELREEGVAQSVSKGLWRYVAGSDSPPEAQDSTGSTPDDRVSEDEEEQGGLQIDEEIGTGDESVYLYYNPNDFRLAQSEGRSTWECKVGHTVSAVDARILGQGARTSLSHPPVVGLVIHTRDARTLEGVLHRALRSVDCAVVDSPGTEWFVTSPVRVKAWYATYMLSLNALVNDEKRAH
jgi:T5orf172 domain